MKFGKEGSEFLPYGKKQEERFNDIKEIEKMTP